jgi:hypothetical protein
MKDKAVKKLSRKELLRVLVAQGKQIQQLEAQLQEANRQLEQRALVMDNVGSLADAALQLNHIFEDADAACKQYSDSLRALVAQEQAALVRIQQREQAGQAPEGEEGVP